MPTKSKTSPAAPSPRAVTSQSAAAGPRPTHRLYRVNGDGDGAIWTPIGAAWPNKDGKGFNLNCDAVPLSGRLVLRLITSRDTA